MKLNALLLGSTLVAALAGFLFGYDTVVISGTNDLLKAHFQLSDVGLGLTVASALVGTVVGSLAAGKPAEWFGRKPVLMSLAVLYFVSAVGCGSAWGWSVLLAFRFIGGLAIGGASVVAPLYIAEISPPHVRGRLVAVSQLNIVAGLLVAYVVNFVIDRVTASDPQCWRWMLGIVAAPSVLFLLLLLPIPESPRWLVKRHRRGDALATLQRLGNADAGAVLEEIVESLHEETLNVDEPFFRPKYLRPILLAFMVASFNQLAGINAVLYYSKQIFTMAGAGQTGALGQSIIIGLTNLVFTIVGMSVIDHFGRRKLLLVGAIGLTVCQGLAAYSFHNPLATELLAVQQRVDDAQNRLDRAKTAGDAEEVRESAWERDGAKAVRDNEILPQLGKAGVGVMVLASLIGFIAFFAFSSGAVIWVFISEIFPNRVRARGQALGSFTHWAWCALINFTFPVIVARVSPAAPFAFFSAMMVLQFVLVWRFLPETKGVSLEEMQRHLGIE